ncbi:MAG: DUF5522 domain-containing protein [Candidatus Sericytochromatia bacterium]|nr:DUF5522 domain-containing protein [Candidatus Sericytochromatia bacterium]
MSPSERLVEGVDYTLERGLMVFTADYLRRRGFCCRNGCRHCPWDHEGPRAIWKADGTARPQGDKTDA